MSYPTWDRAHAEEMKGPYKSGQLRMEVYRNNCEVFKNGGYTTESGKDVLMPVDDPMLAGTKFYSEEFSVDNVEVRTDKVQTHVVNQDCVVVAKQMLEEGLNPAVLNLADADTACGHYKQGWRAQEESLCRATTLSRSLYQYYHAKSGKKDRYATDVNVTVISSSYPMDIQFGGIVSKSDSDAKKWLFEAIEGNSHEALKEVYRLWESLTANEKEMTTSKWMQIIGDAGNASEEDFKNIFRCLKRDNSKLFIDFVVRYKDKMPIKAWYIAHTRKCAQCGKKFFHHSDVHVRFCSDECSAEHQNRR